MNSNAQNHNHNRYCLNNPLRYTDPSGYRFISVERQTSRILEPKPLDPMFNGRMYHLYNGVGGGGRYSSNYYTNWVTGSKQAQGLTITNPSTIAEILSNPRSLKTYFYLANHGYSELGYTWVDECSIVDGEIVVSTHRMPYLKTYSVLPNDATTGDGNNGSDGLEVELNSNWKITVGVQAGGNYHGIGGKYGIYGNLCSLTLLGRENGEWVYPRSLEKGAYNFSQINQGFTAGTNVGITWNQSFYHTFSGNFHTNTSSSISMGYKQFGLNYQKIGDMNIMNLSFNLQLAIIFGVEIGGTIRITW